MTPCRRTRGGDEGFTAIELAIVAPALLIVFGLVLAGMRVTVSGTQVEGAARDAARAAASSGPAAKPTTQRYRPPTIASRSNTSPAAG